MYAFTYHKPTSARQAATLLAKKEDAKLLAGGHTLLPTMKQRWPRRPRWSISAPAPISKASAARVATSSSAR
jgi:CO/xanthine dehydrogenase FAD-binding subunit